MPSRERLNPLVPDFRPLLFAATLVQQPQPTRSHLGRLQLVRRALEERVIPAAGFAVDRPGRRVVEPPQAPQARPLLRPSCEPDIRRPVLFALLAAGVALRGRVLRLEAGDALAGRVPHLPQDGVVVLAVELHEPLLLLLGAELAHEADHGADSDPAEHTRGGQGGGKGASGGGTKTKTKNGGAHSSVHSFLRCSSG